LNTPTRSASKHPRAGDRSYEVSDEATNNNSPSRIQRVLLEKFYMNSQMKYAARAVILAAVTLAGCRTAHEVAVSSFRVIDAPANYVRRHLDDEEPTTTTTTTTTTYQSDVAAPGQPIANPTPARRRVVSEGRRETESNVETRGSASRETTDNVPKRSASSSQSAASTQGAKIPYAKPVPGKPGYVYSPFDPNGGYVDVTGYASGSKAKDPYSGKIFIVP
jgi:hypothetical protein